MTTPILEPVPVTPTAQPIVINNQLPEGQYFTAEQLEAARQQEKDKVYNRLSAAENLAKTMREEVDSLKAKEAERDAEAARLKSEAEAATRKAAEEKMSASELIEAQRQELLQRQAAFEADMQARQALLEKEQQFLTLRDFISRRINEEVAQDNIAPEFLDYIDGNNEAEIEASITKAKEKTASIAAAKAGITTRLPGVSPTGFGPTGPLEQFNGQQQRPPTPEEINAMGMAEYKAYRATVGIDKAGKDRGMFG